MEKQYFSIWRSTMEKPQLMTENVFMACFLNSSLGLVHADKCTCMLVKNKMSTLNLRNIDQLLFYISPEI